MFMLFEIQEPHQRPRPGGGDDGRDHGHVRAQRRLQLDHLQPESQVSAEQQAIQHISNIFLRNKGGEFNQVL